MQKRLTEQTQEKAFGSTVGSTVGSNIKSSTITNTYTYTNTYTNTNPIKRVVFWGTNACKKYFERKDENG